jgi:thioredoxin-related protein
MATLLAFVIHYCIFCDRFEQEAMQGIINSNDYELVVYNSSDSQFLHGAIDNIDNYKHLVKGYPTFIVIKNSQVVDTWEGYEEYQFWIEYHRHLEENN